MRIQRDMIMGKLQEELKTKVKYSFKKKTRFIITRL